MLVLSPDDDVGDIEGDVTGKEGVLFVTVEEVVEEEVAEETVVVVVEDAVVEADEEGKVGALEVVGERGEVGDKGVGESEDLDERDLVESGDLGDDGALGVLSKGLGEGSSVTVAGWAVTGPSCGTGDVGEDGAAGALLAGAAGGLDRYVGTSLTLLARECVDVGVSVRLAERHKDSVTLVDRLRESLMAAMRFRDSLTLEVEGRWSAS